MWLHTQTLGDSQVRGQEHPERGQLARGDASNEKQQPEGYETEHACPREEGSKHATARYSEVKNTGQGAPPLAVRTTRRLTIVLETFQSGRGLDNSVLEEGGCGGDRRQ